MNNPYVLDLKLVREFGKARYYPCNPLAEAMLNIVGGRSLTHSQVRILAEHFPVHVREGRLEPVPFETIRGDT